MSGPVAAIDCGTNTIKLLIGALPDVAVRTSRMVRLGQGVDATGRLAPEALERTFAAVEEYAALIAAHGVPTERIRFCATSATRDASNAAEFSDGVLARLGVRPEVLSGTDEAALAYAGAVRGLDDAARPVLVVDVGGGSTELILGDAVPTAAHSMDIGSVRLTERFLRSDPPTAEEIAACLAHVDAELDACPVDPALGATVVGVAGTFTSVAAGVLRLDAFDPDAIDHARLPMADVHRLCDELVAMTTAQRLELGWMHPGRADVIPAGALIVSRVLARATASHLVVAEADILDGIAWSI